MPTIDPMTEVPLSTVSNTGMLSVPDAGSATEYQPTAPAQPGVGRGERLVIDGQAHRHVGPP